MDFGSFLFYNFFMGMNTRGIFITATGTDVGKTYVSALLLKKMQMLGLISGYYKPAMSGVCLDVPSDVQYVQQYAGLSSDKVSVSYSFEEPISPHLAARRGSIDINLDKILADYSSFVNKLDYVVVEGAGGITCPFNLNENKLLLPDVIKALKLDALVVADAGLGTINSTVLTCEYAKLQGINVKGIILNNFDESNLMHQDNLVQVERLTGVNVVSTVKSSAKELDIDNEVLKGLFE